VKILRFMAHFIQSLPKILRCLAPILNHCFLVLLAIFANFDCNAQKKHFARFAKRKNLFLLPIAIILRFIPI
jgi:hypothetical protein